ncbi:MAG: hypothetical protein JXA73_07275 [Acidobacteria bacterium]|nr:hypothetical protein [Acidobacteriota bacterium]
MEKRPLILWGIDSRSRILAEDFRRYISAIGDSSFVHIFGPSDNDTLFQLRRLLQEVKDSAREANIFRDPEICILAVSYLLEDPDFFESAHPVSEILAKHPTGTGTVTLVLFIPPPLAATQEHLRQVRELFGRIESCLDQFPYLSLIFVNQIPSPLYPDFADNSGQVNLICEQLHRELTDDVLKPGIESLGRRRWEEWPELLQKKTCYSASGFFRLKYPAREALKHLRARFEHSLFHQGLFHPSAITEEDRRMIQALAVNFVQMRVREAASHLSTSVPVASVTRPDSHTEMVLKLGQLLQDVNWAIENETPRMEQTFMGLKETVSSEMARFLRDSPCHLAGAKLYADALTGSRITTSEVSPNISEDDTAVSDPISTVKDVLNSFCRNDFVEALVKTFRESIVPVLLEQGAPISPRKEGQTILDWLQCVVQAHYSFFLALPVGRFSAERFCIRYLEAATRHLRHSGIDSPTARQFIDDVGALLKLEMGEIFTPLQQLTTERDRLSKEIAEFSWLERWFFRFFEYHEKLGKAQQLEIEIRGLAAEFVRMCDICGMQIGRNLLPYYFRVKASQQLEKSIGNEACTLTAFVSGIGGVVDANWKAFSTVPEDSSATSATVLTQNRLDILYQRITQGRDILRFVQDLLSSVSLEKGKPSYSDCHDLGDHYMKGSGTVIDRMGDFSQALFSPLEMLDIMDIIELEGAEAAIRILGNAAQKARGLMELKESGLAARQGNHNPTLHFHVKIRGGEASRLNAKYEKIFGPLCEFTDNNDPTLIDITHFAFGFPFSLIQGLAEYAYRDSVSQSQAAQAGEVNQGHH